MNIFVVDNNPEISARSLCNRHVVKMVSESCKMLSLALRNKWNEEGVPYYVYEGSGYLNHPCSVWTRKTESNFAWLSLHAYFLIDEYEKRFNTTDKFVRAKKIVNYCLSKVSHWQHIGINISSDKRTAFVTAMPEEYICDNAVMSYRNYYIGEKLIFKDGRPAKWNLNKPSWIPDIKIFYRGKQYDTVK